MRNLGPGAPLLKNIHLGLGRFLRFQTGSWILHNIHTYRVHRLSYSAHLYAFSIKHTIALEMAKPLLLDVAVHTAVVVQVQNPRLGVAL